LKFGNAKTATCPVNGAQNEIRLFPSRALKLPETRFKLPVCGLDNEKNIIDVRPRIVFALVPAVGALLKSFVVPLLVLFDEAFQANVSADLESQVVGLKEKKQP
jgi:hypothetical protein